MKNLHDNLISLLEENDITVHGPYSQGDEQYVELEWYSPEGEDVLATIFYDGSDAGFISEYELYALDFDPDEHAEMWIDRRGENGVPCSIRALLDDAEAIQNKLTGMIDLLRHCEIY